MNQETSAPVVAIVGRANVGKSSLFNRLVGRRTAIVAAEPGTTRDRVVAKASHQERDFWLVDTAGAKDPADSFELTIQDQIKEATGAADVIMVVAEADAVISDEDRRLATMALKTRKPVLLVVNKLDKQRQAVLENWLSLGVRPIVGVSAIHNLGLEELLTELAKLLPKAKIGQADDRLRIAILGRPNVGKSALFNQLSQGRALVSTQAGTTRDVNRAVVEAKGREIELLDTAGIRRSGKIAPGVERFSVLRALAAIEEADVGLLVIDALEPSVQLDQKIAGLIKDAGKGLIVVVNKWDLAGSASLDRAAIADRLAADFSFVSWAPLVFVSAVTGQNAKKLFDLALDIDLKRHTKFKTSELNRWLQQVVEQHPPAGLKGRQPRLRYIVWEEGNLPPSFKLFGANIKFLHWSYRRYLEHQFRARWPLPGTPIKFWYIDKKEPRNMKQVSS